MAAKGSAVCARVATRAADGGCSPGHVSAPPQSPHGARGRPGQGGGRELKYTAAFRKMPSPRRQVRCTSRWTPGRMTVPHLPPRGQHRCLRCCRRHGYSSASVEQIVDPVPVVPFAPCVCAADGGTIGGHSCTSRFPCCRAGYRSTQDCMSTPALLAQSSVRRRRQTSWWKCRRLSPILRYCRRTVEQIADIPVPLGHGGRDADLQGFLRGQGPTAHPSFLERISEQIVEQIADIPRCSWRSCRFSPRTEFILNCALSSCLA